MEITELKAKICKSFRGEPSELNRILEIVNNDIACSPFNEYEYLICNLINVGGLTFDTYLDSYKFHGDNFGKAIQEAFKRKNQ